MSVVPDPDSRPALPHRAGAEPAPEPTPERVPERSGERIPVLALRTEVLFPGSVVAVDVERPENLRVLARFADESTTFAAVPVHDRDAVVTADSLRAIGTSARAVHRARLPDGRMRVTLIGLERVALIEVELEEACFVARVRPLPSAPAPSNGAGRSLEAVERLLALVQAFAKLEPTCDPTLPAVLSQHAGDPSRLADLAAERGPFSYSERARLLGEPDPARRLELLAETLQSELLRARVRDEVRGRADEGLRREYLREQLRAIQHELGDEDPRAIEARQFSERFAALPLGSAARRRVARCLAQFRRAGHSTPEAGRMRQWLEWVLELPWPGALDEEGLFPAEDEPGDFSRVLAALDRTHSGLREVKQRVAEYLAVRQLRGTARGTVLCFCGPPGTGKSSMARALAEALGRPFVAIPMAGLSSEGELRGQPPEQDGSGAGAILQAVARSGVSSPVVLLDEIDQVQPEASGAAGALLEVLDRERNTEFADHYLGFSYDLSRCIFLATANDVAGMPSALLDRLEVIEFTGYTDSEKLAIAREHLIPRALERAGLDTWQLRLTPPALRALMQGYTEEAGVRHLTRLVYSLARKAAVEVLRDGRGLHVRKNALLRLLGPAIADDSLHPDEPGVGLATGLAWTAAGGALLPIEALAMPGSGRAILTGQLGDVLRESVQAAISYVRTRSHAFGLDPAAFEQVDLHLHFPSAATPKDGPSAGIAIAVALLSILGDLPVRHDVAMTGELSLHGDVLPVGGIREKLLAAVRAGITEVIVPRRNDQEVLRLPSEVRSRLVVHHIDRVDEAFQIALLRRRPKRKSAGRSASKGARARRRRRSA